MEYRQKANHKTNAESKMSEKIHKFSKYTVTEKEIGGGWIWLSIKYDAKKDTPSC